MNGAALAAVGPWIVRIYRRAWHPGEPRVRVPPDRVDAVVDNLLRTGGGALGHTRVVSQAQTAPLHEAYRLHALQHKVHEATLERSARALRRAGVEGLLLKGWSMARRYPRPGLRPFGDHDWLVRERDLARARAACDEAGLGDGVDLHTAFEGVEHRSFDQLAARAERHPLGGESIAALGPVDHLRALCMHFVKHGGERPMWLVDVAILIETTDLRDVVARNAPHAEAIALVLGAAVHLLDARPTLDEGCAIAQPPPWVTRTIVRAWARGRMQPSPVMSLQRALNHPAEIVRRWPNPLATAFFFPERLPRRPLRRDQLRLFGGAVRAFVLRRVRAIRSRQRG